MRATAFTGASALILLVAGVQAKHGAHEQLEAIHRRHRQEREIARQVNETVVKRGGTCAFPANAGLIPVTPESGNGGWAFAPDQQCYTGRYCPYACPPGEVSMQWDPSVSSYTYPGSRNGGLLCNPDGTVSKPFPDKPYCQPTSANIGVQNTCGGNVAFCQTVLPGDEDMLIPTDVSDWAKLAVPDTTYWAGTAAHYYINPPGVSSTQGCIWGSTANPHGNWAPYVAGANTDNSGQTFIKLGWNPIYLEPLTPFRNRMPDWGVRIECPNGGCNGLPCAIDPKKNKVNEMLGSASNGAGGGSFCVVTVQKGATANFVVFDVGGGNGGHGGKPHKGPGGPGGPGGSGGPGGPGASGWGNAGQFYQSDLLSSGTKTGADAAATRNATSVAFNSTSTSSTSEASETDSRSTSQHYQLFDTPEPSGASNTANSAKSTSSGPVAQHTGGASTVSTSFTLVALAVGAMLL